MKGKGKGDYSLSPEITTVFKRSRKLNSSALKVYLN